MEISHAKLVLDAILEGCDDEAIIRELIDTAWKLIRDTPKDPPPKKVDGRTRSAKKPITVNDREFRSITAACKFYDMTDRYKTVLNDLEKGVHPEDIFPREKPVRKTLRNTDPRNGLVLPN